MMRFLDEQGFEIVSKFVPAEMISAVTESISNSAITRSRAGMRRALQVPAVRSLAEDDRLVELASHALGQGAFPFRATLFYKSAQSNWLVVWHQDTALPLKKRGNVAGWGPWSVKEGTICAHAPAAALEQVVAVRVHLDDSNAENGVLKILPGTHNSGVLSDDAIHQLATKTPSVECCANVGGVLLMRPLVVHASSKMRFGDSRRVLHIEYASRMCFDGGLELAIG